MLNQITHSGVYVLDQDQALDFYVGVLGMEVADDVDLGFMRWLTVRVPGDETRQILLEVPGPPVHDEPAAAQLRELVSKGALGLALIVTVDDCQAEYERLRAAGVEFYDEPTERPYGIDCGFRDPFGNALRMTQPIAEPRTPTPADFG